MIRAESESLQSRLRAIEARLTEEGVAKLFHYFYELYAPSCGYETREESRKDWENLPSANKELMLKTVTAVLSYLRGEG
jgi:hypothetical protein